MTGSSQNRIVNSKSWQFSVGSHPTLLLNRWKDSYWLQFEGSFSPTPCPSQDPAAKLTPGTALMRKWPALRAVGGPPIPCTCGHQQSPPKAVTLWKAAETCLGISKAQQKPCGAPQGSWAPYGPGKAWQKPWDTLKGSRAPCRTKHNLAEAPGCSGGKQGPLWEWQESSDRVRWLWLGVGLGTWVRWLWLGVGICLELGLGVRFCYMVCGLEVGVRFRPWSLGLGVGVSFMVSIRVGDCG